MGYEDDTQIATIEATLDLCSQNLSFLMYMIHLSSILVYFCIIHITQINLHNFFQRILKLLNMLKHTITLQEMPKITVSKFINETKKKKKKKFCLCN